MTHVTDAFEDLAQALRVLLEADARANRQGLIQVDRAEAVGNIEIALASVFNAFHSLYDALDKVGQSSLIDWYNTAELAIVLILRNARHHNQAKKVRTMYSYYAQEAEQLGRMEMYVLVDFPSGEDGGETFDVYLSWSDLKDLFRLPQATTRIRPSVEQAVCSYLGTDKYLSFAEHFGLGEEKVFFNVVPLLVNAATKVVPLIKTMVTPRSTESKTFLALFADLVPAATKDPEVYCGPIVYGP